MLMLQTLILSHWLCPSEIQPLCLIVGRFFSRLPEKVLPLAFSDVLFEHSPDGNGSGLPDLIHKGEKPLVVSNHVFRFHRVFEDFNKSAPDVSCQGVVSLPPSIGTYNPDIHHGTVIDPQATLPQFRPLSLFQVAVTEILRFDHQQTVIVGVGCSILTTSDFHCTDEANSGPALEHDESHPGFAHQSQYGPQFIDRTVANSECNEEKPNVRVVSDQAGECAIDTSLPHHRPSPLADRTMAHAAEPRSLELEFRGLLASGRIAGESDHLAAVPDSICVTPMSAEVTTCVDLFYLISLGSVGIPRLMFGRNPGKVFRFPVDLTFHTGYSEKVTRSLRRHVKAPYTADLVIQQCTELFAFCLGNSPISLHFLQRPQLDSLSIFLSLSVIFTPEVIPHSLKERLKDYEGKSQTVR